MLRAHSLAAVLAAVVAIAWMVPTTTAATAVSVPSWKPLDEPSVGGQITSLAISPANAKRVLAGGDVMGVGVSTDGGNSWRPTFGFASWEIADITFDPIEPAHVWAGTMSGPYLSTDGGVHWTPRRTGLPPLRPGGYSAPVQRVLIDPRDDNHLLAFGGSHRKWPSSGVTAWGAVWESHNGGAAWTRKGTVVDGGNVVGVDFVAGDPIRLVAAVANRGVYASGDGGATWRAANTGLPTTQVAGIAAHPHTATVWVAIDATGTQPGGVWKSGDGGLSWHGANAGLSRVSGDNYDVTSRYDVVAVAQSSPDVLYTADKGYPSEAIFRSTDGGSTWTRVASHATKPDVPWGSAPTADAVAIDPRNPKSVIAGQQEYMLRSYDGGNTWTDTASVRTTAGWQGRGFSGLVASDIAFNRASSGEVLLTAMDGGNLIRSVDGTVWTVPLHSFDAYHGATSVAVGAGGAAFVMLGQSKGFNGIATRSSTNGAWSVSFGSRAGLPDRSSSGNAGEIEASQLNAKVAYASIDGVLYGTRDGGSTWSARPSRSLGLSALALDPANDRHLYAAGPVTVYETLDGGTTFHPVTGAPPGVTRLVFETGGKHRVFAVAWRTTGLWQRAGTTWQQLAQDPYIADVAVDPFDTQHIVAVTNDHPYHDSSFATGVWVSTDSGAHWTRQNDGLPEARVATVAFDPAIQGRIIIGTYGRGFFERTESASTASLRLDPVPAEPSPVSVRTTHARFGAPFGVWLAALAALVASGLLIGLAHSRRRRAVTRTKA